MKITQVVVNVLRVPVDRPYVAGGRTVDANWHVLARVTTSDGVEGVGYIVYPRPDLMTAIAHAAREMGEHLVGMSILEPEAAWDRLARRGDWVGPGGLLHCALCPLDVAVWDATGKTLGQPLHRLLGGYRDRLPTYASDGLWYSLSPDELAASARRHVDAGFGAVKLRLGREAMPELEARQSLLLHMPEMAQRLEALRTCLRGEASLPQKLQELAMISVAREMSCAFIWYAHAAAARQAGVRDDIVDAIREKRALANLDPEEQTVVDFTRELLQNRKVSRPTFDAATARFGQRGTMTLTNLIACYAVLAYNMNTYDLEAPAHPTEKGLTI